MAGFTVEQLREDRAVIFIHTTDVENGVSMERDFPGHLVRAQDGSWQITFS